jgi:hypothetical protein
LALRPNDVSLGIDGVTADAMFLRWHFIGGICVKAVKAFWHNFILTSMDAGSVTHKGSDRDLLTNWRPMSLVTIMYNIMAKLLANRLKPVIPRLVDSQQKRFVHGRKIQENILGFKLGQEFLKHHKLDAFFLKLNFVKDYDRVKKNFLWNTLEAIGFLRKVIQLVQDLALLGTTN